MAREADVWVVGQEPYQTQLERFANLVAAAAKAEEREGIAKFFDNKEEIPFLGRHIAWKIRSGEA